MRAQHLLGSAAPVRREATLEVAPRPQAWDADVSVPELPVPELPVPKLPVQGRR